LPRRDDGTAIRFEFQVFDTPKGRVIVDHLDAIKAEGGSVAAFIREALFFYIQHQAGDPNSAGLSAHDDDVATSLPVQATGFSSFQGDDEADEVALDVRQVSGEVSAQNFLTSVLGLQQQKG